MLCFGLKRSFCPASTKKRSPRSEYSDHNQDGENPYPYASSFNPSSNNIRTISTFLRPVLAANIDNLRCRVSDISTVILTVASLSGACSLLIKLGCFDWIGTESGVDASGFGGLAIGNAASGVSDAVGAGAGDTTNVGIGGNAASFVPKTNASRALSPGFPFLSAHVNAPMISLTRTSPRKTSPRLPAQIPHIAKHRGLSSFVNSVASAAAFVAPIPCAHIATTRNEKPCSLSKLRK